ncbi:MAG: type II toxin-antitoxin system Phd/YefM family antitoxin [Rhodospirillales bacterium]|nr:type II toxin-antitoxin system Phd/YefM family antitoxin [Rhodospirillales bacterium]
MGAFEAKTHFSRLLERAEHGEEITITRRGKPVAKLVPVRSDRSVEKARGAAARIRELAEEMRLGSFEWDEWKNYRDEGRK